jgi:hypothetical protein
MSTKMDNVIVLDEGNHAIKAKTASKEWSMQHAIHELSERDYEDLMARTGKQGSPDVYLINGTPYAFGKTAELRGFRDRRYGSDRYIEGYYGAFLAAALFNTFPENNHNIILYASHAPKDLMYRSAIQQAAERKWTIEALGERRSYTVKRVYFFDEPQGGLMNLVLDETGRKFRYKSLLSGDVLGIDVGGYTSDFIVMSGGEIDYMSLRSVIAGTLQVEERFLHELRTNYAEQLQSVNAFKPDRLRAALETGKLNMGGLGVWDVRQEVASAKAELVRSIADMYRVYGGKTQNDFIVVTGGGAALLEGELMDAFEHPQFHLACGDGETMDMRFANVRGGLKTMRMLDHKGML